MKLTLTIFITLLALSYCDSQYLIGGQGQSCDQACSSIGKSCNARIVTNGNIALFNQLNISCIADTRAWWAADQPSYVSDPSDKNYGRCLGYIGAPVVSQCSASFPTVKRLCRCDNPQYLIGDQGQSCNQACFKAGKNCNPRIVTNNTVDLFNQLGISCVADTRAWWAEDQPSYASDPSDKNYGKCLGLIGAPDASQCSASFPTVKRLCRCDDPVNASSTFGTGYSAGDITTQEKWIFQHFVAPGDVGVLTHFWITYPSNVDKGVIVRYYIDGETKASIEFTPSLACGVGFYDQQAPWGTEWFGKGSNDSGWFNNFRIPFQKSIVVTIQHLYANYSGFYMIVRGSVNVPITVGGRTLPTNARMNQVRINSTYQSLDWVPLVNVSSGPGVHWMATIAAESGNLNFLEGCVHAYFDGNNEFPGVVLGTGTEDYFDSAWYFNAGQFHMPVSGFTHLTQNSTYVAWSAYRFHDSDPLFFKNGFQLIWRNGDLNDNANMKCHMLSGGKVVGNPTASKVTAYAWYYTWPAN